MKIFFSHSSSDKALVREIKLGMHDFLDIWMDERQLLPGEPLDQELNSAINKSDLLVLFLSRSALKSKWVALEISAALKIESAIGRPFLIPVILDRCRPPKSISQKLYLTLSSQDERDVRALASELNEKVFHLVLRYQITPPQGGINGTTSMELSEARSGALSSYSGFIKKEVISTTKKYLRIIDSNVELRPQILMLLVKEEAERTIAEATKKGGEWSSTRDNRDDNGELSKMSMLGVLGSTMFDVQEKLSRKILDRICFLEENAAQITPQESIYILKKFIVDEASNLN